MTLKPIVGRRPFLLTLGAILLEQAHITELYAQIANGTQHNFDTLRALLQNIAAINYTRVDILFLQSWRLERRPMKYEQEFDFIRDILANRTAVFQAMTSQDKLQKLEANSKDIAGIGARFGEAYEKNRSIYEEFLQSIGVAPNGPAGRRITQSTLDFAYLNVAMLGSEVALAAERRSFVWPRC